MAERRTGAHMVPESDVPPSPAMTVDQRRAIQAIEYGVFESIGVIMAPSGSAPAYGPGAQVPVSNVLYHEYDRKGEVRYQSGWEDRVKEANRLAELAAADKKGWGPLKDVLDEFVATLPELPAEEAPKPASKPAGKPS